MPPEPIENSRFDGAPRLSGRQPELLRRLNEVDPSLGQMFLGIYAALSSPMEPDRLEQACHSARELMEKLPRHVMETTSENRGTLTERARNVAEAWRRYESAAEADKDEKVPKKSRRPLSTLIKQVKVMSEWMDSYMQKKRPLTRNALRALDVSEQPPLEAVEEDRISAWLTWSDFFTKASHHSSVVDETSVREHLERLEGLLIDLLIPPAASELSELDEILGVASD